MEFLFKTFILDKQEYAKIMSEINTNYMRYVNKPFPIHISHEVGIESKAYLYYFENHGYNNYNIYMKIPVE